MLCEDVHLAPLDDISQYFFPKEELANPLSGKLASIANIFILKTYMMTD